MKPEHFVTELASLHRDSIVQWKKHTVTITQEGFLKLVEENHGFNYQLWHAEDRARREDMGFEFVYQAKRDIDRFNQQRNNRMEMMDAWLSQQLQPAEASNCRVHSETPGMMIDRLSILALKHYHMAQQCERTDVDTHHRESCQTKRNVIQFQQQQLVTCLCEFLHELLQKTRTFVVYHQFKMYNDPSLNPELYTPGLSRHYK